MKKNNYTMTKLGFEMYQLVGKLGVFVGERPALYYILNLTWGLPMTILGYILTLILWPFTCERKHYNYIFGNHLVFGRVNNSSWGFSVGTCFFTSLGGYQYSELKKHEFGHTCQNAILGPFQLFLVLIPSVVRYWRRAHCAKKGIALKTGYYDIWFERSATDIGNAIYDNRLAKGLKVE